MAQTRSTLSVGLLALEALAACAGDSAPVQADADLKRDLQLASSEQGIELLPSASQTQVVSAIEQTGTATTAPSPTKARVPQPKPRRVAPKPRNAAVASPRVEQPAPRPTPRPVFDANVISPPPPGGYKTVDEVIRNAPFPIKP